MGSPEVIAKNVISQLENLDNRISTILEERMEMRSSMKRLEAENEKLQKNISNVKSEISQYLKELEEIKAHYVSSNDNN
jgi:peptidoglycan hydrolase CwlO-like protein